MSSTARIGRIIFAVLVVLFWQMGIITGGLATLLLVVSAILAVTAFVGFCPIYSVFGINSHLSTSSS